MSQISSATQLPGFSVVELFDRTLRALSRADAPAVTEIERVLEDCSLAQVPDSPEEFSRALTQKIALEKTLEHTARNIRVLRGEDSAPGYGRHRGRNL